MSNSDIAPISDEEVEDILSALDAFGATVSRATSVPAEHSVAREEVDGCTVLRPDFNRR